MTLLLPTKFYSTIKIFIKIMDAVDDATEYIMQDLLRKLISWLSYLFFFGNHHCHVIQLSYNGQQTNVSTNLFLDASLASG